MQKIAIATLFDITETGIVRNYKPALAQSHKVYKTEDQWDKARNQQRNFETIMQVISLRANPYKVSTPIQTDNVELDKFGYHMFKGKCWIVTFQVESDDIYRKGDNIVGLLLDDLNNVPMIQGLDDNVVDCDHLKTQSAQNNIFAIEAIDVL